MVSLLASRGPSGRQHLQFLRDQALYIFQDVMMAGNGHAFSCGLPQASTSVPEGQRSTASAQQWPALPFNSHHPSLAFNCIQAPGRDMDASRGSRPVLSLRLEPIACRLSLQCNDRSTL